MYPIFRNYYHHGIYDNLEKQTLGMVKCYLGCVRGIFSIWWYYDIIYNNHPPCSFFFLAAAGYDSVMREPSSTSSIGSRTSCATFIDIDIEFESFSPSFFLSSFPVSSWIFSSFSSFLSTFCYYKSPSWSLSVFFSSWTWSDLFNCSSSSGDGSTDVTLIGLSFFSSSSGKSHFFKKGWALLFLISWKKLSRAVCYSGMRAPNYLFELRTFFSFDSCSYVLSSFQHWNVTIAISLILKLGYLDLMDYLCWKTNFDRAS